MIDDALRTSLLDLAYHFDRQKIPIILGGGYGLFLRQLHLLESTERTVLDKASWPAPRSTEDLDIFLRMSIVADSENMQAIANILSILEYVVIDGSEHWQFKKQITKTAHVKIDLMSGPVSEEFNAKIHRKSRRLRPKEKSVGLHARATDEAIGLEEGLSKITIEGMLSDTKKYSTTILIPHAFTFIIMKLHAFSDRLDDAQKELGQHHAFDIFRIVAMMTENDLDEASRFAKLFSTNAFFASAQAIANSHFYDENALGLMRIKKHPLYRSDNQQTAKFIMALRRFLDT